MLRPDGCLIQLGPELCGFFTQRLVIIDCCKICIAFFTVQPTVSNHISHSYYLYNFQSVMQIPDHLFL